MALEERPDGSSPWAKELAAFLLFGGIAALTNLLVGWQLYGRGLFPALPYWSATALAAASGLLVNFALNYAFNFKFRDRTMAQQFWTFCLVSVVGIAITSALSEVTLGLLHALAGASLELAGIGVPSVFAAHAVAVGVTVLYSFPAHKILSFNVGIRGQLMHVSGQLRGRA